MSTLKNHPTKWLRDDAANAFDRLEEFREEPFNVLQAGRSEANHKTLIDRWNLGGPPNRPPYFEQPDLDLETATFVREGGIEVLIDPEEVEIFEDFSESFGFVRSTAQSNLFIYAPSSTEDTAEFEFVEED